MIKTQTLLLRPKIYKLLLKALKTKKCTAVILIPKSSHKINWNMSHKVEMKKAILSTLSNHLIAKKYPRQIKTLMRVRIRLHNLINLNQIFYKTLLRRKKMNLKTNWVNLKNFHIKLIILKYIKA